MTMSSSLEDPFLSPVIKAFDHVTLMLEHNKKVYIEKRSRLQELMQRKTELEQACSAPTPDSNQQQQELEQQTPSSNGLHRTGSTGFYSSSMQTPPSNIIHSPSSTPSSTPSTPPPAQPSSTSQNPGMPPPLATSTPRVKPQVTSGISSITTGSNPSYLKITDETSGRNPYRAPSGLSGLKAPSSIRDAGTEEDPGATYTVPTPSGFTTPSQNGLESSPVTQSEDPTGFPPQLSSSSARQGGSTLPSGSTHQGGFTQPSDSTQPSGATQQSCGGSSCANGTTTGFQVLHCPDCNAKLGIVFEIFHLDGCPGKDSSGSAHTHN